jgi:hypothetical protein
VIDSTFESCRLKIGRAREHLDSFKAELAEWCKGDPYSISKESNSDGSRHCARINIQKAPGLHRWSLIGGDCVHNLRSALDHVVYGLAIQNSGSNPPPKSRTLEFPIFDSAHGFRTKISRIDPISDRAKAYIEGCQPYKSGNTDRSFCLRALNEFNNADKHRLLNVAVSRMGSGEIKFSALNIRPPERVVWNINAIEDGMELVYFLCVPPQPYVNFKVEVSVLITVSHVRAPNGALISPLVSVLDCLYSTVANVVDDLIGL